MSRGKGIFSKLFFFILITFCFLPYAFCQSKDIEGQYFTIKIYPGCNLTEFAGKLNAKSLHHVDLLLKEAKDIEDIISQGVDALFLKACDILDMHLYSYHGTIKLCPDIKSMHKVAFRDYSDKHYKPDAPAVYRHSHNTIYISFSDFSVEMIGHEIAHVIISNYFAVVPPVKMQEILAGYVEFSLRKEAGTLYKNRGKPSSAK
ncbi:MAG: hypothetical protein ABH858_01170 [Candidatus Omnitrophota bacterium]